MNKYLTKIYFKSDFNHNNCLIGFIDIWICLLSLKWILSWILTKLKSK
jgi:hypothetical protein